MDAKEISAFLTPPKLTARETLLAFTGAAIALLLRRLGTAFISTIIGPAFGAPLQHLFSGLSFSENANSLW